MSDYRLHRIRRLTCTFEVMTGLRVGANQENMEISGLDNPIVRNPATAEPFLPGSSIRGRMRSLAEWHLGELPADGNVIKPKRDGDTGRVFGLPATDDLAFGPTRLLVRDARLSSADRQKFANGQPITEVKSENSINRLTAMANPRPMERVLPGVRFDGEFVYRVFDTGDGGRRDEELFDSVFLVALALLEMDAIGGASSRGCGQVKLELAEGDEPIALPKLSWADRVGA